MLMLSLCCGYADAAADVACFRRFSPFRALAMICCRYYAHATTPRFDDMPLICRRLRRQRDG